MVPVLPIATVRAPVLPGGIVADGRDPHEQIHVAHDLREDQLWNVFEREGFVDLATSRSGGGPLVAAPARVGPVLRGCRTVEANLIGGKSQVDPRIVRVG